MTKKTVMKTIKHEFNEISCVWCGEKGDQSLMYQSNDGEYYHGNCVAKVVKSEMEWMFGQ